MTIVNIILVILTGILVYTQAQACPCGCGAVNAQVMYPGETWRFATSMTHDHGFAAVDAEGHVGTESSPETRQTLTLGLARAFTDTVSGTLSIPFEVNRHSQEGSDAGMSDPSVSVRNSVYQQSFVDPWVPGIQVFGTFKPSWAKSIYDDPESEHQMDIHGNGFQEWVAGVDFWYDLTVWKLGFQQSLIAPQQRAVKSIDGSSRTLNPGLGEKSAFSAGYNWIGQGQLLAVVEQELRQPLELAGAEIPDSEKRVQNVGLVGSMQAGVRQTIGINYKRTAAFGTNRNTSRADSYGIYMMKAI